MNELWSSFLSLVNSGNFWSAIGALAIVAASTGIFLAGRQLRFEAWLKGQEIFTENVFVQARATVFKSTDLILLFFLVIVGCKTQRTKPSAADSLVAKSASAKSTQMPDRPIQMPPRDSVSEGINFDDLRYYLSNLQVDDRLVQNIDSTCAVIVYPDEEQIAELKKRGEEAYNTTVDDGTYYQGTAIGIFNSLHIRTVDAEKRFLRFQGIQQWILDIRKRHLPYWNLFLYSPDKGPKIVNALILEKDSVASFFGIPPDTLNAE